MTVCSFSSFGTTISSSLEHEITIVSEANVINMSYNKFLNKINRDLNIYAHNSA